MLFVEARVPGPRQEGATGVALAYRPASARRISRLVRGIRAVFQPQMASKEIDQQFVVLIFYLAIHGVTLSLVEVDLRTAAMPLQPVPQAACHVDGPSLVSSAMT